VGSSAFVKFLGVSPGGTETICLCGNQAVHGERCPEVANLGIDNDTPLVAVTSQYLAGHLLERDIDGATK
jgi:hypothetical protein